MSEPEKPFACTMPDCGKTFTNEDHLHVHTKKHDMMLQLGSEQKSAFVADQTPTPTRFIRNCEEVGLFQDLQAVNPFDEGFKRAMETKPHGVLSLENVISTPSSDDLHTPQMIFPLLDGDAALYSTSNNQRNITISRSSSDESGAIKEFEKTTISKLTNEVTISRIEKHDDKNNKDIRTDSVSYTNNVIKVTNIRKDSVEKNPVQTLIYEDRVIRDSNLITKDCIEKVNNNLPPIMSQKSLDLIVDSLNSDFDDTAKKKSKIDEFNTNDKDYEVIIKLPNGKQVRMKAVDVETTEKNAKDVLKKTITDKVESKKQKLDNIEKNSGPKINPCGTTVNNINLTPKLVPQLAGTFIPVTLVNTIPIVPPKLPIVPINFVHKDVKRRMASNSKGTSSKNESKNINSETAKEKISRCAASKRYRARLKATFERNMEENKRLRDENQTLNTEISILKNILMKHIRKCPDASDLSQWSAKMK